jgi:hypothetical protein
MSVTTTTNSITRTSLPVLGDYELHHSGTENDSQVANPDANSETTLAPQPRRWPSDHRRVPPYRPTNRNLDMDERPGGINAAEFVFIQVMLHGVWLNAVCFFSN